LNAPAESPPALWQRLSTVAPVLQQEALPTDPDPYIAAGRLVQSLVRAVQLDPLGGRLWLLIVALSGAFPTDAEVQHARRVLELATGATAEIELLDVCARVSSDAGGDSRPIELVVDRPVVDVHFTSRTSLTTGIQRVVRNTVPAWADSRPVMLARWTETGGALCRLGPDDCIDRERPDAGLGPGGDDKTDAEANAHTPKLVVPWQVPLLVPEVPFPDYASRLASMARHSGCAVKLIGYDCIPLVSADLVAPHEHEKFARYLEVVKYASTVACISDAAAEEFAGFSDMLASQGLRGPTVVSVPLPSGPGSTAGKVARERSSAPPSVVCLGSIDRRKNQIVVLEAAERLWREGYSFSLRFLGSGGLAPPEFDDWLDKLVAAGRPVTLETAVSDDLVTAALAAARFSVFPTLHEGFGLPVAESLALGIPVLTSAFGSTRALAAGRGGVTFDPRDADSVTYQMRRLLTDDAWCAALREEALAQPLRTWNDYAADLWDVFECDALVASP
jgi:glycosyltransferase involved in cell wall biosynthesis